MMPRYRVQSLFLVPVSLFLAALLFGYALRQLSTGTSDGLILAAPLGFGWIAPLIWGRRAVVPILMGSILAAALSSGPPELVLAAVALATVDTCLGWCYSRVRTFPDGLNRIRDLLQLSGISGFAALARALTVYVLAVSLGLESPKSIAFATFGLAWFFNLLIASIVLVPFGRWHITWTVARIGELILILSILAAMTLFLFSTPNGLSYTFASAVGMVVAKTWLGLRFHIRGMGLHRTIWFALFSGYLVRTGTLENVLPLARDPDFCCEFTLVLCLLLFVELTVAAMASDRMIEAEVNKVLNAQLISRNIELERLSAADRGQKAFLDSVLNHMPAGVMIVGQDGTMLWRNQRHRTLWGEATSQSLDPNGLKKGLAAGTKELPVPFENWPIVKAITAGVVTEGFEARIHPTSHRAIDLSISAAPVHDPAGHLLGAVSILHDMSDRKAAMRQLREKEERLRFALKSARMIAYEWKIPTQILQASESIPTWIGLETATIDTLTDLIKVVHPNDVSILRESIDKLVLGGKECECEFRVPSDSGMLWVQCRGRRLIEDDGKLTDRVAGILIDVSDRRRSEERLRMLESAVVHARDAVVILEPEPNRTPGRCVLYANDAFCEMTGYVAEELLGRSLHLLRGPDSDPNTLELLRDALDHVEPFKGELLNYHRNGTTFWVELSVVPVPDSNGQCAHWVMIQRDISDRKKTELILQHNQAMLADAQRIAHIGSWESIPQTGECRWSAEKFRIFGYEPGEIEPTAELHRSAIHPDDREKVDRSSSEMGQHDYPYSLNFRIVRPTGEIRFITEEYCGDFDAAGKPVRFWGVTQDETEKRQSQEQLFQAQKMELIGQMAGGIAHDFNNLLTGIIGNLHLARLPEHDPNQKHVDTALRAANRAADLTKKLLGFARKNQLFASTICVADVVSEVVSFIVRTFDPRVRVLSTISEEHRILADSTLVSQVLLNLCLNARDAMPHGGRLEILSETVTVPENGFEHRESSAGEFIRLVVEDTGHGMAPEILARVFEPFFTTKPIGQGTGLGLAMVHGIMTQHRGWVEVRSEVGRGTRFDLYLPRSADHLPIPKKPPSGSRPIVNEARLENTPMPISTSRQTILIVDDETMIRDIGRAVLEAAGFDVLEAEDGEVALETFRVRSQEIDLVVLDLTMPKLSGQDTFHAMAEIDPHVRILFSSGYSAESLIGTEGAIGLLPKPYRPQILLETVRRALAHPSAV